MENFKEHHMEEHVLSKTCFASHPHILSKATPAPAVCPQPLLGSPETRSQKPCPALSFLPRGHALWDRRESDLNCSRFTAELLTTASHRKFNDITGRQAGRLGRSVGFGESGEGEGSLMSPGHSAPMNSVGVISGKPW